MEEIKEVNKPALTIWELFSNWVIARFFGVCIAYFILDVERVKLDLVDAFGIRFFAIVKGAVLLASILFGILGGQRLAKELYRFKRMIKFVDVDEVKNLKK